jgi:hypothetical protein
MVEGSNTVALQFKGMKVPQDVPSIGSVGRAPSVLPDHPVWKISEPAVALGLLEVAFPLLVLITCPGSC